MNLQIIKHVFLQWRPTNKLDFGVTLDDGKQKIFHTVKCDHVPTDEEISKWRTKALKCAHSKGYYLEEEVEGNLALKCFRDKSHFVKKVSDAISGCCGTVEEVTYEVFCNKKDDTHYQEYIVVHYVGGAIAPRTVNMNSNSAILSDIAKMTDGGYYEEVKDYNKFKSSKDWYQL